MMITIHEGIVGCMLSFVAGMLVPCLLYAVTSLKKK